MILSVFAAPLLTAIVGVHLLIPRLHRAVFLVPAGVMVAANAVNMLAGFNGMEAGMGLVAMGSLAVIAATIHATTALIIL